MTGGRNKSTEQKDVLCNTETLYKVGEKLTTCLIIFYVI